LKKDEKNDRLTPQERNFIIERRCKPKMKKFTLKISIPENLKDFNSAEEWVLSEG
jgi:hypothetical protein